MTQCSLWWQVLAVRLYTGPGFQPINGWLREVAMLPKEPPSWFTPRWGAYTPTRAKMSAEAARRDAALDASSSFGATVGHLIAAIRKLTVANTAEENNRRLYRGLKGVLPGSFWLPDQLGVVCATDAAFMSTSLGAETPIHYMQGGGRPNLLFEIEARAEDDTGYHCGADVAILSQFASEREVLFPPLSLLRVRNRQPPPSPPPPPLPETPSAQQVITRSQAVLQVESEIISREQPLPYDDGKCYMKVVVVPSFTG